MSLKRLKVILPGVLRGNIMSTREKTKKYEQDSNEKVCTKKKKLNLLFSLVEGEDLVKTKSPACVHVQCEET